MSQSATKPCTKCGQDLPPDSFGRQPSRPDRLRRQCKECRALHEARQATGRPLAGTWRGMMARCYSPEHQAYGNYGGRGIAVCAEWHSEDAFTSWVLRNLGPRPAGYTLDRINNDGNYEPCNVRWATRSEQAVNRRSEVILRGSALGIAKLTEDIVREARMRWAAGESQHALAAAFSVSVPTMHKALTRKTWRHVALG